MNDLDYETVREYFDYHEDGYLTWKIQKSSRGLVGSRAGNCNNSGGYWRVTFNKITYAIHRLIYVWHHGQIDGELQIDHINNIRTDNRIENLRLVSGRENMYNLKETKGYSWCKGTNKWRAYIRLPDGVKKALGRFDTEDEARTAYLNAKKKYHVIEERA